MDKPLIIFVTTATASNKTAEENLGLAYLAAVCRKRNYEVIIIDGWLEGLSVEEVVQRIQLYRTPLFIGFSCNQLNGTTAIESLDRLKKMNCKIPFVAGGFAPTFNPSKFLEAGFDYVSLAEGEETILSLCDYLLNGKPEIDKIRGLCYLHTNHNLCYNKPYTMPELDSLPFPCRDTMELVMNENTPVNISASRGCMANCLFCSVSAFWRLSGDLKWRGRSVNSIVDELEQLYNQGARHFKFVDESFIEPPRDVEWCNKLADEIIRRGLDIRLRITLRADRVSDEIIDALTRAGCNLYACGIENFSNTALRRMGKKSSVEDNKKALDIFHKHKVYVQMGFILFDYGTTFSELKENYKMLKEYSWTICRGVFSEMYAARGTSYTKLLENKGVIKGDVHLENFNYEIADNKSRMVYFALKRWHISHMRIYNMVIEPINKPKVLNDEMLAAFYELYLEIRKRDLDFMGNVLNLVGDNVEKEELNEYVNDSIRICNQWFEDFQNRVVELFGVAGIEYLAEDDPFTYI